VRSEAVDRSTDRARAESIDVWSAAWGCRTGSPNRRREVDRSTAAPRADRRGPGDRRQIGPAAHLAAAHLAADGTVRPPSAGAAPTTVRGGVFEPDAGAERPPVQLLGRRAPRDPRRNDTGDTTPRARRRPAPPPRRASRGSREGSD